MVEAVAWGGTEEVADVWISSCSEMGGGSEEAVVVVFGLREGDMVTSWTEVTEGRLEGIEARAVVVGKTEVAEDELGGLEVVCVGFVGVDGEEVGECDAEAEEGESLGLKSAARPNSSSGSSVWITDFASPRSDKQRQGLSDSKGRRKASFRSPLYGRLCGENSTLIKYLMLRISRIGR